MLEPEGPCTDQTASEPTCHSSPPATGNYPPLDNHLPQVLATSEQMMPPQPEPMIGFGGPPSVALGHLHHPGGEAAALSHVDPDQACFNPPAAPQLDGSSMTAANQQPMVQPLALPRPLDISEPLQTLAPPDHHQTIMLDPGVAVTLEFYAKRVLCFALAANRPQSAATNPPAASAAVGIADVSSGPSPFLTPHPLATMPGDTATAVATAAYSVFSAILSTHLGVSGSSFLPANVVTSLPFSLAIATQLARLVGLVVLAPPSIRAVSYAAAAAAFTGYPHAQHHHSQRSSHFSIPLIPETIIPASNVQQAQTLAQHPLSGSMGAGNNMENSTITSSSILSSLNNNSSTNTDNSEGSRSVGANSKLSNNASTVPQSLLSGTGPLPTGAVATLSPDFPPEWLVFDATQDLVVALRTQAFLLGPDISANPPEVAARAGAYLCTPGSFVFPERLTQALEQRNFEIYKVVMDTFGEIPIHLTHAGFLDDAKNALRFLVATYVDPCAVLENLLHNGFRGIIPSLNNAAAAAAAAAAVAAAQTTGSQIQHSQHQKQHHHHQQQQQQHVQQQNQIVNDTPRGVRRVQAPNETTAIAGRDLLYVENGPARSGLGRGSVGSGISEASPPAKRQRGSTSASRSSSSSSSHGGSGFSANDTLNRPRYPDRNIWSKEEEDALEEGMREFGPRYSTILAVYGPTGTRSKVLEKRGQIQLKDKARNMRLRRERAGLDPGPFIHGIKYSSHADRAMGRLIKRQPEENQLNTCGGSAIRGIVSSANGEVEGDESRDSERDTSGHGEHDGLEQHGCNRDEGLTGRNCDVTKSVQQEVAHLIQQIQEQNTQMQQQQQQLQSHHHHHQQLQQNLQHHIHHSQQLGTVEFGEPVADHKDFDDAGNSRLHAHLHQDLELEQSTSQQSQQQQHQVPEPCGISGWNS